MGDVQGLPRPESQPFKPSYPFRMPFRDVSQDVVAVLEFRREWCRFRGHVLDQSGGAQKEESVAPAQEKSQEFPGAIAEAAARRIDLEPPQVKQDFGRLFRPVKISSA